MNAPLRTTSSSAPSNPPPQPTSSTLASLSTSSGFTASEKKLRRSPYISLARGSDDDDGEFDYEEYYESLCGSGSRVFELDCLQTALLEQCSCKECGSGPIEVQQECHRRMGLVIHPYLYCCGCSAKTPIGFKN